MAVAAVAVAAVYRVAGRGMAAADRAADRIHADAAGRIVEFARAQPVLRAFGRTVEGHTALDSALAAQHTAGRRMLREQDEHDSEGQHRNQCREPERPADRLRILDVRHENRLGADNGQRGHDGGPHGAGVCAPHSNSAPGTAPFRAAKDRPFAQ